jgi:hypothetical protein
MIEDEMNIFTIRAINRNTSQTPMTMRVPDNAPFTRAARTAFMTVITENSGPPRGDEERVALVSVRQLFVPQCCHGRDGSSPSCRQERREACDCGKQDGGDENCSHVRRFHAV